MNRFVLLAAVMSASTAFAATDYEKLAASSDVDVNAAPIGTEWHAKHLAEVNAATGDDALAAFLSDAHVAEALLSRVKSGYQTDPLDAVRIAAITQYVMIDVGSEWYEFWKCHRDGERRLWAKALLSAAKKANGAYLKEYFLDQLRWCGYPCQARCVREIGANGGSKAVRDFAEMVARELETR